MEDSYKTIKEKFVSEGYYTEKRSKFLAFAHHVETVDEVKEAAVLEHERALEKQKDYLAKLANKISEKGDHSSSEIASNSFTSKIF